MLNLIKSCCWFKIAYEKDPHPSVAADARLKTICLNPYIKSFEANENDGEAAAPPPGDDKSTRSNGSVRDREVLEEIRESFEKYQTEDSDKFESLDFVEAVGVETERLIVSTYLI